MPEAPAVDDDGFSDEEVMNAPLHYFAGSCLVCKATPSSGEAAAGGEVRLSRCASCLVVRYCGKQHQKLDWRRHKPLCRWLSANIEAVLPPAGEVNEPIVDRADWLKSRAALLMALRLHVRRELQQHETEVIVFAPVCDVCGRFARFSRERAISGQLECSNCCSAFYCSLQHQQQDADRHAIWCAPLRLSVQCDRQEALYGVADPAVCPVVDSEYEPLTGTISEMVGRQMRPECSNTDKMQDPCMDRRLLLTFLTERLTFPLTVLYALQQISTHPDSASEYRPAAPLQERRSLLIHVVGARALVECVGIIKWEYLVHRLPALQRLHLVMIGPQLFDGCGATLADGVDDSGVTRCSDCQQRNRQIIHEMRTCCYHEFCERHGEDGGVRRRRPDLIVCFNSGLHEFADDTSGRDTWAPTLPLFVAAASTGTPLLLTAYTHPELIQDVARLPGLRRLLHPVRNPFGSCRPVRDAVRESGRDVFFMNQYLCVLGRPTNQSGRLP